MSSFAIVRRWPFAASLCATHIAFVLLIYWAWTTAPAGDDPNMVWLWTFLFDFPISLLYLLVDSPSVWPWAVASAVLGGLQWTFLGSLVDNWRKNIRRKHSLRATPNT